MNAYPHPSEQSPTPGQSLLQFTLADVTPLKDKLLLVTGEDLLSFVDVRKDGAADDMLTAMYGTGLTVWHNENGRGGDEAANLEYEGGLLYGKTLAKELYLRQTGHKLIPDDPDAGRVAELAVKHSYDNIPETCETPWQQENFRELAYTHTHLLSVLNAVLDDHITQQMTSLYERHGLGDGVIDDNERVAFYRGLIDSMIFYNSYARWKDHGLPPESFVEEATALLEDRRRRSELAHDSGIFGEYSLDPGDDIADFVMHLDRPFQGPGQTVLFANGLRPMVGISTEVLRQTGPNTFLFMPEVIDEVPLEDVLASKNLLDICYRIAGWTVVTSGIGSFIEMNTDTTTDLSRHLGNVGLALGAVAGIGSYIYYRWKYPEAFRAPTEPEEPEAR